MFWLKKIRTIDVLIKFKQYYRVEPWKWSQNRNRNVNSFKQPNVISRIRNNHSVKEGKFLEMCDEHQHIMCYTFSVPIIIIWKSKSIEQYYICPYICMTYKILLRNSSVLILMCSLSFQTPLKTSLLTRR